MIAYTRAHDARAGLREMASELDIGYWKVGAHDARW